MKLYYLAGSCALAPHIALEARGLPYQAVRIERGKQADPEYLAVNPLGRVPALVTASHGTITEVPAVLSFIADAAPDQRLLAPAGASEHYEALRWLAYLSSTVHPAFGRLCRAERFTTEAGCTSTVERAAAAQIASDFRHMDRGIAGKPFAAGMTISIADFYLFVFGRWGLRLTPGTREFPNLHRHTMTIAELDATRRAMTQQGITLEEPKSGPG